MLERRRRSAQLRDINSLEGYRTVFSGEMRKLGAKMPAFVTNFYKGDESKHYGRQCVIMSNLDAAKKVKSKIVRCTIKLKKNYLNYWSFSFFNELINLGTTATPYFFFLICKCTTITVLRMK